IRPACSGSMRRWCHRHRKVRLPVQSWGLVSKRMYIVRRINRKIYYWCACTNKLKGPPMKFTSPFRVAIAFFLITLIALAQGPSIPAPPATPKRPVADQYQGVKITDDYRWLENWDDPEVKQWSAAQNARSREYLDHLPGR